MEQRVLVKNLLEQKFSLSELESLCFDLGVDAELLPGQDKIRKAIAVVEYFQQHYRWQELISALQRLRPQAFMQAELETCINSGDVGAIRGYLDKHREVIAAGFGNSYSSTLVHFHCGEEERYYADYLCITPHSNVAMTSIVLLAPSPYETQHAELQRTLSLLSEYRLWVERNARALLELVIERLNQEDSFTANRLARYSELPENSLLDASCVIIASRRRNYLAEVTGRMTSEKIKMMSYDRLIEAAQGLVSNVI
jgi:hypothetical protein